MVTSSHSFAVLASSYPPSNGSFHPEIASYMKQFLQFLANTSSTLLINAYPYFAYKGDPQNISLNYALSNPTSCTLPILDTRSNLHYYGMLDAQVDAVIFAITRMGHGSLDVAVSETGWPSKGDNDEPGASLKNAQIYGSNLVRNYDENKGTPVRPENRLEVYLFALFNENDKAGPLSERNYGLFEANGSMAYNVGLFGYNTSLSTPRLNFNSFFEHRLRKNMWSFLKG